jgi:hypothetical protein
MKSRIIAVSIVLMLTGLAAVFATGQKEEAKRPFGPRALQEAAKGEKISVSGPVAFEDKRHPEITSGGREYELIVPRFALRNLDIEEGQSISVEGYALEGTCCEDDSENEVHLLVTKATIGDQEYDLETPGAWGPQGPGRRGFGRDGHRMRGGPDAYGRGWRS